MRSRLACVGAIVAALFSSAPVWGSHARIILTEVGGPKVAIPARVRVVAVMAGGARNTLDRTYGQILADELLSSLGQVRAFQVVDRENIRSILREQQLAAAGITDEATAVRAGKIMSAQAIVYCHVHATYQQRTQMVKQMRFTGNRNRPMQWVTVPARVELGAISTNFRMVDTESGQVYQVVKADASYNSRKGKGKIHIPGSSQKISVKGRGQILHALNRLCADRFMRRTFRFRSREVALRSGKHHADKQGVDQVKAGHYESALESFAVATETRPDNHRAWYNRGILHEYFGQWRHAYACYKKATDLRSNEERYATAMVRLRRFAGRVTR